MTLRVVGVSGSLQEPSKTTVLVREIVAEVARESEVDAHFVELASIGPRLAGALARADLPADVEEELRAIETASPVYRGSFTGLFKHLFDFVDQYALIGHPVLLAATGGGERHALVLEHQLRPLFGFFQALTLPVAVYASTTDFEGYELRDGAVRERIRRAVEAGRPLVEQVAATRVSEYVSTW